MPPTDLFVIRFAAEPPQELLPYGRWAERLSEEFLAAADKLDGEGTDLGTPGDITWFPDRTWNARTYVPATCRTSTGVEFYGWVSFFGGRGEEEPSDFAARVEWTEETADQNPDWELDLNDDVIGEWRGEAGRSAQMTLVWGVPLLRGGAVVTAELADVTVDQCMLVEDRFTLLAPDDYRGDFLEVTLWNLRGGDLASESLYVEDDDEDEGES